MHRLSEIHTSGDVPGFRDKLEKVRRKSGVMEEGKGLIVCVYLGHEELLPPPGAGETRAEE